MPGRGSVTRELRPASNDLIRLREDPFVNHRDVADDTGQAWRSAASLVWTDHRVEIRPISPLEPPHLLKLTTPGRETAVLLRGGFSTKRGFILPIL